MRYLSYFGFMYSCIISISLLFEYIGFANILDRTIPYMLAIWIIMFCWFLKRRVNDTGISVKWLWLTMPIQIVIMIIHDILKLYSFDIPGILDIFMFVTGDLSLLGVIAITSLAMLFIPGTAGNNRYGPPPPKNTFITGIFFVILIVLSCFSLFNLASS